MKESALLYFLMAVIVAIVGLVAGSCEETALGMEKKVIPDKNITSSTTFNSSTPTRNGRLNFAGFPWCAGESDASPYLMIDLGKLHAVCAVATQGNSKLDQWVETYQLQTFTDEAKWTNYEEGGEVRDFQGNTDKNTKVKQVLFEDVVTRYIRIVPKAWRGSCCLRVELYGVSDASCQTTSVGIEDRSKIPNHRMTASTYFADKPSDNRYQAYQGRFDVTYCAWEAKTDFTGNDFVQVDLGGVHFICALATKGNGCPPKEWTKKYKIHLSLDNKSWNIYKKNGVDKNFVGNTDRTTANTNIVPSLPRAKFIRFWPTDVNKWAVLRVEVYGAVQGCRSSLGMEDKSIKDSQLTAHPSGTASNGRLYNSKSWCSNSDGGYIQVDLGQVKTVTGVANQGHPSDKWGKSYHISYQYGSSSWEMYKRKEDKGRWKSFDGNMNFKGWKVNWFPVPIIARYIRVVVDSGTCLRFDLYGCENVLRPRLSLKQQVLTPKQGSSVDVVCNVISQPHPVIQWWFNNTDVTSLSSTVIHSGASVDGVSVSTLRVNFTSADDIAANYDCIRKNQSSRAVTCVAFSCTAFYDGIKAETKVTRSAAVTVTLYVPAAPLSVKVQEIQARTATLQWNTKEFSAPESILSYTVKYHPLGSSLNTTSMNVAPLSKSLTLSNLVPNTNYNLDISNSKIVGGDLWNVRVNFKTAGVEAPFLPSGSSSAVIPAVAGVSALLLIALLIVGFLVWKRRRGNQNGQKRAYLSVKIGSLAVRNTLDRQVVQEQLEEVGTEAVATDDVYSVPDDGVNRPIPALNFAAYAAQMKRNDSARLRVEFKSLVKVHKDSSSSVSKKPENKLKNRYANITTYDHSRVILENLYSNDDDNDYINASYMPGYDGNPRTYIATQGPRDKTVVDFWNMVWQQNSTSIIMLTNLVEAGKSKCVQYWPDTERTYGTVAVSLHEEEVFPDYMLRTLHLKKDGVSREVRQFHFTSWPDKGVPQYPTAVLAFRRKVRSWKPADSGPTVVHCSAGVGRTGTYIVIDAMIEQAKKVKTVDIFNYTRTLRENRPHMVQTDEQYIFLHDAVLQNLTCDNTEIPVQDLCSAINKLSDVTTRAEESGYKKEFKNLRLVSSGLSKDESEEGRAPENAAKNRFPNIVPLDASRVILRVGEKKSYINASFVDAYRERNAFIMTQAPLESTIEDFWLMALQYKIGTIVMLNSLLEGNEEFSQYWPSVDSTCYGKVRVETVNEEKRGGIVLRSFKVFDVKRPKHVLMVKQHHHSSWPDKTVPANHESVLDLLTAVQSSRQQSDNTPIIVHCSDGVGRSGTFCAIYSAVERLKLDQVVDVFQTIKLLRVKRPGAVETLEQYVYCYEAVQRYVDSFSEYANFAEPLNHL